MLDHRTMFSQAHPSNANAERMNIKLDVNSWKLSYQLSTKGRSWENESLFMRNNIIYNGFCSQTFLLKIFRICLLGAKGNFQNCRI